MLKMIPLILLALASSALSMKELCPDRSSKCPDSATCCQLADMSYGCCPLKNAVCCDDHIHCCPQNTKCDAGICIQLDGLNVTSLKLAIGSTSINCFGSEYTCPDDSTCCKRSEPGTYACCPMDHAVCCEDGQHCCPEGTRCDVQAGKCIGQGFISEMYDSSKNESVKFGNAKFPVLVKSNNVSSVICPDSSSQCPNGNTCCQLPGGSWGCCPYEKATCCRDHLHCCPENMKCDAQSQQCSQGLISVPSVVNKIAESIGVCPDNTTCADSETCCRRSQTHFGCCPYPNAVCCSDHQHCCPSNYTCDVEQRQCLPKKKSYFKPVKSYLKKLG